MSTALHDWDEGRMENLRLACQAVHGAVIPAGGSFSFNEALGERTEEKGYRPAIAFQNGEKVMEVGGGVCQVSTSCRCPMQEKVRMRRWNMEAWIFAFRIPPRPLWRSAAG